MRARLAGYRDTLARHKIDVDPDLVVAGDFQESGGLLALDRRSIRVPDDISIIGFDDLHSSMYTTPPLTTVRQPLYEVGTCIANMLLPMLGQPGGAVDVPALSLVVRESVRRIT